MYHVQIREWLELDMMNIPESWKESVNILRQVSLLLNTPTNWAQFGILS